MIFPSSVLSPLLCFTTVHQYLAQDQIIISKLEYVQSSGPGMSDEGPGRDVISSWVYTNTISLITHGNDPRFRPIFIDEFHLRVINLVPYLYGS